MKARWSKGGDYLTILLTDVVEMDLMESCSAIQVYSADWTLKLRAVQVHELVEAIKHAAVEE